MSVAITRRTSQKKIKKLLAQSRAQKKKPDISRLFGRLKWKGDALKVQRTLREE